MDLSFWEVFCVFISDIAWICEWALLAMAHSRHKRWASPRRWIAAILEVVLGTLLVVVVMKVASFDPDDPTSLRPSTRKTSCGAFDLGKPPSPGPAAGYPSGHAYMTTLASVLLTGMAYFEGAPWSWAGVACLLNGLTLVARRGLMCHSMAQIVDGAFLGLLVGAGVLTTAYAPTRPTPAMTMTILLDDSENRQPVS
jgi:membrane-associated phospholipid phosphatase